MRNEALEPLLAGRRARWRTFDWQTGEGLPEHLVVCDPAQVIVLDGVYSARPELADLVGVSILLTLNDETRRKRLLAREGESSMARWHGLWDEAEELHFSQVRPPESFDVVVATDR